MVDELWQEQTMVRLLTVVELPMLDGLLQCIQNPSPSPCRRLAHNKPDLVYNSSSHLDRGVLKALKESLYVWFSVWMGVGWVVTV